MDWEGQAGTGPTIKARNWAKGREGSNVVRVELPKLHPGQIEVAKSKARFRVVVSGRRWGKTKLGSLLCIVSAVHGRRSWWVAPSYKMGAVGWRDAKALARNIPGVQCNNTDRRLTFQGGGTLDVRSASDPQSLRGEGLDFCVLDECAYLNPAAWVEAIRPALSDRKGRALFISTPRGSNWFREIYKKGLGKENGEWKSFKFPTQTNPWIDPKEIDAARQMLPSRIFNQEYEAEFLDGGGGIFNRDWFPVVSASPAVATRCRFWDCAGTQDGGDWTVGTLVSRSQDGTYYVEDVLRGQWSAGEVARIIVQAAAIDGQQCRIRMEQEPGSAGKAVIAMYAKALAGYDFCGIPATGPKEIRWRPLAGQAEAGNVRLVNGAWVKDWLDELTMVPVAPHDDQADSAAGAFNDVALGVRQYGDFGITI